ncbi:transporter substrate-binding domain-containing protein [Paucibacter sp. B2R-40]|uniref:substrate-binding periplasmic protein n=1 Tax=Paucibacter sp. B2R-40 TaxID=2893554 RepID=UPI0021E44960|nr:transporter substrate-binding domain-containing protein [Paucibacter sp. B2R-40]MCV2353470.1 transporter substrate-binding domain-containing protein [Paucibacter sp. B2R-40]
MQMLEHWLASCCAGLALAACASGAVQAAEFKVDVIQFEPWAYRINGGTAAESYAGVLVEYMREFERRSGHTVVLTLTPYARVELNLKTGATDFSLMVWSDARAAYARRGAEILPLRFGVRLIKGVAASQPHELRGLRMGVPRGLTLGQHFDADPLIDKQMTLDYTQAIRMVVKGRGVAGVAGSLATIDHLIRKLQVESYFGEELFLNNSYGVVAFSMRSKNIALEREVNAVFESIAQDGTAARIYRDFMSEGGLKAKAYATGSVP